MDGAGFITQIQPHRFDQHLPASLLGTLSCHPSLYTAISQNIKKGLTGEVNRIDHLVTMRCSPGENRWCWHSRGGHLICNAFSKHCWSPSAPHTHTHTYTHTHTQQQHSHILTPPAGSDTTLLRNGVRIVTNSIDWASSFPWSQSDPQESQGLTAPDTTGRPWS